VGDAEKRREELRQQIETAGTEIDVNSADVASYEDKIARLRAEIADEDSQIAKARKLSELQRKLTERISKAQTEIAFYHDNDTCPTCQQGLPHDLKENAVATQNVRMAEIETALNELANNIETVQNRLDEIHGISDTIALHNKEIIAHNNAIIANQKYIQKLETELHNHKNDSGNIDDEKVKLRGLAKEVVNMNNERTALNEERYYQEIAGSLLKDTGIKTRIVRQYLPVINKLVNKYLNAMDFFVSFELDEAFNETIKSRHRDDFSYASFSEGEKQRIDLALLFTWRTIAKMKNSAATNLLLLDEVFDSSLDINGTDYLMNVLNTLGEDTRVFVISHKGDQLFDKFRSVIKFEKHQNFSRIAAR
jgi:DNA repair exonuclease SbcCD ATPase subunit